MHGVRKDMNDNLVYVAGFMDGEGSIVITRSKSGRRKNLSFDLNVTIANNNKEIHDWLVENFGGSVSASNRWKRTYQWKLTANQAKEFLEKIVPYLKIKKEQAILAIEFQKSKSIYTKQHLKQSNYNGGNVIPITEINRRNDIALRMRKLNYRDRLPKTGQTS